MPLFRGHVLRSVAIAGLAILGAHQLIRHLPDTVHILTLTQTSVAIVALSSLMLFTVAHHQRGGRMMTQTQEEMVLIGAFGLFWLCASPFSSRSQYRVDKMIPSLRLVLFPRMYAI
ncbi:hypothetical protein SCHPADRAFT_287356 [Schizopora paradoxa]|uniref:Uncharacterized protein n=1 Tax=Schizopora paradoxa TaxID=27342 RepID=A0A0H2RSM2_9AGAM|nr:hypothetical protein SCHPADRAFT_287356 [Schizopora paradoxa]